MRVEERLRQLGLILPEAVRAPPGIDIPFAWVRLYGDLHARTAIGMAQIPLNLPVFIAAEVAVRAR